MRRLRPAWECRPTAIPGGSGSGRSGGPSRWTGPESGGHHETLSGSGVPGDPAGLGRERPGHDPAPGHLIVPPSGPAVVRLDFGTGGRPLRGGHPGSRGGHRQQCHQLHSDGSDQRRTDLCAAECPQGKLHVAGEPARPQGIRQDRRGGHGEQRDPGECHAGDRGDQRADLGDGGGHPAADRHHGHPRSGGKQGNHGLTLGGLSQLPESDQSGPRGHSGALSKRHHRHPRAFPEHQHQRHGPQQQHPHRWGAKCQHLASPSRRLCAAGRNHRSSQRVHQQLRCRTGIRRGRGHHGDHQVGDQRVSWLGLRLSRE